MSVNQANQPNTVADPTTNTAPANNGQQTQTQDPNTNKASGGFNADHVNALIEKARSDERAKLHANLERERAEAKKLQDKLEAERKAREAAELAANKDLSADEKLQRRLDQMSKDMEAEKQARLAERQHAEANLRAMQLDAYKHRRIGEVGVNTLLAEQVGGNSTEEIDASIMVAQAEYKQLRERFYNEFAATAAANGQHLPSVVGSQNPAYTPPPGGYMPNVAPVPVPHQQAPDLATIQELTSEESLRNGTYANNRHLLKQYLQSSAPAGFGEQNLGLSPRGMPQGQYVQTAQGGVVQPHGYPTGPVSPSQQYQTQPTQVQPGNPGAAPSADPRALAMAAAARTHAGQNPVASHNNLTVQPNQQGNALAAFQNRFSPTPPLTPNN